MVVIGRIRKPEAIVSTIGGWVKFPIPPANELARQVADDAVADSIDLSQPVDAAVSVGISRRGVDPLWAISIAVKGFDFAKAKLGESHRLTPAGNGSFRVEGIGKRQPSRGRGPMPPPPDGRRGPPDVDDGSDDGGDEDVGCVIAHAVGGSGRLVCGASAGLEALAPYLTRTMPKSEWPSDIHIEVRPEPVRAPLSELRGQIPILARGMMGGSSSPAVRAFVDASVGELVDVVNDTQKLSFDGKIADSGIEMTTRFDYVSSRSVIARMMTATDKADSAPASFWHLPAETDTAFFGRGSDPKLFDHPRELLTALLLEASDAAQMPEAEKRAVKDLVADRMLTLFVNGGTGIYAKGYDHAAVEKVFQSRHKLKPDDLAARVEADRVVLEQVVGWHLYQTSEPIAKVGPVLKDWAGLWNRPSFAKWAKERTAGTGSSKPLPKMRVAPLPAAVVLPKDTVHLEITIERSDIEDFGQGSGVSGRFPPPPPIAPGPPNRSAPVAKGPAQPKPAPTIAKPAPAPKKIHRSPIVFHIFAVPDGGATWLAFGMDAKLVAQRAAASLATAPETGSLTKSPGLEALREGGKLNGGGFGSIQGLAVFAALEDDDRSPFQALSNLPGKGAVPITFTGKSEGPNAQAKVGSASGQLRISRAVIEDAVKLMMALK